ncbi:MAG: prolipoprotein diacylglyceryl transferase [Bacteroidetes bacterium]|nr:prolipoprotein diacylglyceryl transferase [Bacteroidota bacterium]
MILLRAFGTVWDFVNWVFGTHFLSQPPNMYGTFVAAGFIVGFYIGIIELKRRESLGILHAQIEKRFIGKINWTDILTYAAFGFLFGMKGVGIYFEYDKYAQSPNDYILSSEGSIMGGLIVALIVGSYNYYLSSKTALAEPKEVEVRILPHERMGDILILALIGGIFGSKLWDIVGNPAGFASFIANPINSMQSGLSVFGGLWGAAFLIFLYSRKHKLPMAYVLDSLAPAFFLPYAVGRIGCQMSGDGCWGIPTTGFTKPSFIPDFLWGQSYAHNVNNDGVLIANCTETFCYELPYTVFPTPIYEIILVSILFAILWKLRARLTKYPLMVFSVFMIMNGIERFTIEFIRINTKFTYFGITLSKHQFIAIIMMSFGAIAIPYILKKHKEKEKWNASSNSSNA